MLQSHVSTSLVRLSTKQYHHSRRIIAICIFLFITEEHTAVRAKPGRTLKSNIFPGFTLFAPHQKLYILNAHFEKVKSRSGVPHRALSVCECTLIVYLITKIGASVNSRSIDSDQTLHEATPGPGLHWSPDKLQISCYDKKSHAGSSKLKRMPNVLDPDQPNCLLGGVTRAQTVCVKSQSA